MSKEVTRFFGALLIIGSLGGAYLGIESLQKEVTRLEGRVDTSRRLYSDLEGHYREELKSAEQQQEDLTPVLKVMGGAGAVFGLFLLIVAPVRTVPGETPEPERIEKITPKQVEEEDTYMVVWTTGKNASDPNIRDDYQAGLTYPEAVAKYEEIAALDGTYIASIVAVVESTDYSPHSKHA